MCSSSIWRKKPLWKLFELAKTESSFKKSNCHELSKISNSILLKKWWVHDKMQHNWIRYRKNNHKYYHRKRKNKTQVVYWYHQHFVSVDQKILKDWLTAWVTHIDDKKTFNTKTINFATPARWIFPKRYQ